MISDTKRRIEEYKAMLPGIKERIIAVALMLAMSLAMVASTSYAWLTISRSPEAKGMTTTITGNGNLEIALAPSDGSEPQNATGDENSLLESNITWGNLINLADARYGLDQISLRPALLSGYNRTSTPLYGATYGEDGRVTGTSDKYGYAQWIEDGAGGYYFSADSSKTGYGIRAISSITYANISGDATATNMLREATNDYVSAQWQYLQLIENKILISSPGVFPEVYSMDALVQLIQVFVQDKANYYASRMDSSQTYTEADYSGVVTYAYRLALEFEEILDKEGEALVHLANLQAFKNKGLNLAFEDITELLAAYNNGTLESNYGVKLDSLETYSQDYTDIRKAINGLQPFAERCDPDKYTNPDPVKWSDIKTYVNYLVNVETTAIAQTKSDNESDYIMMKNINSSTLMSFVSIVQTAQNSSTPADVLISDGILARTEQRLPEVSTYTMEGNETMVSIFVTVKASFINLNNAEIFATIRTKASEPFISNDDRAYTESLESSSNSGDAVANDTYGMAIDMWVRTNVQNVVLTLEGNLETTEVVCTTVDKDGQTTTLYMLTTTTTSDAVTIYGVTADDGVTTYYNKDGNEIGTSETMTTAAGYTIVETSGDTIYVGEEQIVATPYSMTQTTSSSQNTYLIKKVVTWYDANGSVLGTDDTLTSEKGYTFAENSGEFITVDGVQYQKYTMTYKNSVGGTETTTAVYKIETGEDTWYNADTHTEIGTVSSLTNSTYSPKTEEWVTGYDGVNRVWEDFLSQIEAGLMAENNTTQGAGSCYVFYADPSDQARILRLLEAFTVVFMDKNGITLGTAKLDTEHYYSINGKTTVPLKMISGTEYLDENGDRHIGVMPLNQNEATFITAVVYLDGQLLSNADVLAVGEIEGTLNVQFGSSVSLNNLDDSDLRFQFRDAEVTAAYVNEDGQTLTSYNSKNPITVNYDGTAKKISVSVLVDGTQPDTLKGFFVRSISSTQGTKGETVEFIPMGNNTWVAEFYLTAPGTYIMRSLIVDGVEYKLDDGTANYDSNGQLVVDSDGDPIDNYPCVVIDGMGINSIRVEGLNQGITMTAESTLSAEVVVAIDATEALMPSKVRAIFVSSTGEEVTALLYHNYTNDTQGSNWSGTVTFTESGVYTLEYVVMDGQFTELTEEQRSSYIIYLGLTAQVYCNGVQLEDGTWSTTFPYKGRTELEMKVKIFDSVGAPMQNMEDVWLYYFNANSSVVSSGMYTKVEWDGEYYTGTFELSAAGTYVFNSVVTNKGSDSESRIEKAGVAPTIVAMVVEPPRYFTADTLEYQFAPTDSDSATMSFYMVNAQTSTMWVALKDDRGGEYLVLVEKDDIKASDTDDNIYRFTIDTPVHKTYGTRDGEFTITGIYMQGVAKPVDNGANEWVPEAEEGTTPTEYNSYFIDLVKENIVISTKVVQTVKIAVEFEDQILGAVDTNEDNVISEDEKTAVFMETQNFSVDSIQITDRWGDPIEKEVVVKWSTDYNEDSSGYGGYTFNYTSYQNPPGQTLTSTDEKNFSLSEQQSLTIAGTYSSKYTITIPIDSDNDYKITVDGANYAVYSKLPTVTISSVNTNASTDRYYTSATPGETEYENMITGSFNSKIDNYNAVVYMYFVEQSHYDNEATIIKYPIVTLGLSGVPNTHSGVTMVFDNDSDSSSACTFTFAAGATTASSSQTAGNRIGGGVNGSMGSITAALQWIETYPVLYPAGKQTVQTITVTYGGVTYTVTLSDAVTINNPLYPPYATFNSTANNGQTLPTTPSTIYGTPNADGTFTITLPGSQTWTEAKSSTTTQDFTVQSGYPQTATVYYTWSETTGGGCNATTTNYYLQYTKTTTVSVAASTTSTWTRTWKITGWRVGNTTYAVGETITIEGHQTFTPVLSYTDGTKSTSSSTTTRTEYYYTQVGKQQTGTPSGTTISDSERTYTETNPYQNDVTTSG